jgi:hypothetical protein
MNRINALPFAIATTMTFLLLYVACALAVVLFPDGTVSFFNAWLHGLDLNLLKPAGGKPLTWPQFVTGFAGVVVVAFPAGFILASIYDLLLGRSARTE